MYDVSVALQEIEEELISSMQRNMKRHCHDQDLEGIDWSQWQAEMLKGLKQYEKDNIKKFPAYFSTINDQIDATIKQAFAQGESEQEIAILQAIKRGWAKADYEGNADASFFRMNERKLNALINATTGDLKKGQSALLRRADDIYRQTLYATQFKYATGYTTLYKAMDAGIKDFLSNGIDCIQYKNGARVNIASYCEMALRTTNKRAALMGGANKRMEYGVHTVIISAHSSACPICVQWQGRVYYDDVYGSITDEERKSGNYPLLSEAVAGGMFHPNCKNGLSTFYEGVNTVPPAPTDAQKKEMQRRYLLEQEQRYCERNVRKYKTLENSALDADDKAYYAGYRAQWNGRLDNLITGHPDVLRAEDERLKTWGLQRTVVKRIKDPANEGHLSGLFGKDHAANISDIAKNNGTGSAKDVWREYGDKINAVDAHSSKWPCYSRADQGMYFDIDALAKGDSYNYAYGTLFHESGHNIDNLAAIRAGFSKRDYFTHKYENGKFADTIKREVSDRVDALNKQLKAEFTKHASDPEWLYQHGAISKWDLQWIKDGHPLSAPIKYSKAYAYKAFEKEIRTYDSYSRADISDMLEGATNGRIQAGYGHGKKYWTRPDSLGTEAFAEMYSAEFTNPDSLAVIKKYLPDSYAVFQEILKAMVR